jgi:hypothetical protein
VRHPIYAIGGEIGTCGVDTVTLESPSCDFSSSSSLSNSFILTAGKAARLVCPGTSPAALRMQFLKASRGDTECRRAQTKMWLNG